MSDRPTIVMVHGLVGSLSYFDPQSRCMRIRVRAPDLLGYGALRHVPPGELSLVAQAEHLTGLLDVGEENRAWLVGHSMGGAVAMLAADRRPDLVAGVVNVEGNFTEKDTFWSRRIVQHELDEWEAKYQHYCEDAAAWLDRLDVVPTAQRAGWADTILANQPASTVLAMAHALVHETHDVRYEACLRRVVGDTRVHLVAGERSADAWGVPDWLRDTAASYTVMPEVGHLMMLEDPDAFCSTIEAIVAEG